MIGYIGAAVLAIIGVWFAYRAKAEAQVPEGLSVTTSLAFSLVCIVLAGVFAAAQSHNDALGMAARSTVLESNWTYKVTWIDAASDSTASPDVLLLRPDGKRQLFATSQKLCVGSLYTAHDGMLSLTAGVKNCADSTRPAQ